MAAPSAFSWNSELPSGHNPFWIRDDALLGLGLHIGDAVAVDTQTEPANGDLVVCEADPNQDGDSLRLARRYFRDGADQLRLEPENENFPTLVLPSTSVIIMGVIKSRVVFQGSTAVEEPL